MGKSQNRHAERERSDISLCTVWACSNDVSEKAKLWWQKADWWLPQNIVSWLWWWFYGCIQPSKLIRLFTLHGCSLFSMKLYSKKVDKKLWSWQGALSWELLYIAREQKSLYSLWKTNEHFPISMILPSGREIKIDIKPMHKDVFLCYEWQQIIQQWTQ